MMTDIEIAQSVQMKPIVDIAKVAGIGDDYPGNTCAVQERWNDSGIHDIG